MNINVANNSALNIIRFMLKPNRTLKEYRTEAYTCGGARLLPQKVATIAKPIDPNSVKALDYFTGDRQFKQRGMTEEAAIKLTADEWGDEIPSYKDIQARRRRERDQAQKWKRSGKVVGPPESILGKGWDSIEAGSNTSNLPLQ